MEIIKVLYRGAKILILDEPTAVLVPQEVEALFQNIRELKAKGSTILFIDHKLDEVLAIADTITVLRQGRSVATVKPADVTAHDLAELMVGSELPTPDTTESTVTDIVVLEISNVTVNEGDRAVVSDVSLNVHRGEVVGVAGVEGNGQSELVDAIVGTRHLASGSISMLGEDITRTAVRHRREHGLGYIPQDRQREGLLLAAPLWENAALGHQTMPPFSHGFWMDRDGMRDATEHIRRRVRCTYSRHRRRRPRTVGRQPAEADRRQRDVGKPDDAHRGTSHSRYRCRRPGSGVGPATRRPCRRAGDVVDQRRSRRTDRSLRHHRRHASWPARCDARPCDGHPPRPRCVHDRRDTSRPARHEATFPPIPPWCRRTCNGAGVRDRRIVHRSALRRQQPAARRTATC